MEYHHPGLIIDVKDKNAHSKASGRLFNILKWLASRSNIQILTKYRTSPGCLSDTNEGPLTVQPTRVALDRHKALPLRDCGLSTPTPYRFSPTGSTRRRPATEAASCSAVRTTLV